MGLDLFGYNEHLRLCYIREHEQPKFQYVKVESGYQWKGFQRSGQILEIETDYRTQFFFYRK